MAINRQLYNQVMMLDDFTCVYCGARTPEITVDHYIPQSQGGPDVIANLYACCATCNTHKRDRAVYDLQIIPMYGRFQYVQHHLQQKWLAAVPASQILVNTKQEAQRLVLEEGLSIREAARRVGRAESTVRSWLPSFDENDTGAAD